MIFGVEVACVRRLRRCLVKRWGGSVRSVAAAVVSVPDRLKIMCVSVSMCLSVCVCVFVCVCMCVCMYPHVCVCLDVGLSSEHSSDSVRGRCTKEVFCLLLCFRPFSCFFAFVCCLVLDCFAVCPKDASITRLPGLVVPAAFWPLCGSKEATWAFRNRRHRK